MYEDVSDKVLEKHLGILGINGSGKTYTAKGLVERLLDREARVCIIDPTGVWWGLKSSSSGKKGAYKVVVFGGEHADMQISGSHGEAIAEAIGTSNTPAIIDTSLMRGGERTKFFTDFAETLRIKNSGPLHLFIDEAHLFCPQGRVSDPNSAQMLHAANNLISLGRSRGLRVTLISQRPAKMHKDSLTQVHSLIAMRLIAPQDRNAVEDWIADQADVQRGKEIIASLPGLKTGEGYLWAPELKILERVKFPEIKTFDSSRSPDAGQKGHGPVLSPIDLSAVEEKLKSIRVATIDNDPGKLRARIRELEKQLAADGEKKSVQSHEIEERAHAARRKGVLDGYKDGVEDAAKIIRARVDEGIKRFEKFVFDDRDLEKIKPPKHPHNGGKVTIDHEIGFSRGLVEMLSARGGKPSGPSPKSAPLPEHANLSGMVKIEVDSTYGLGMTQKRIIRAMQFWLAQGQKTPTREMVAGVAGYRPGTGNFKNIVGGLVTAGLLSKPSPGCLGLCNSNETEPEPMSHQEAREMLLGVLDPTHIKIINTLTDGEERTREEVAQGSNYAVGSGNFKNLVGNLCTLKILMKPAPGRLMMSDWAREILG